MTSGEFFYNQQRMDPAQSTFNELNQLEMGVSDPILDLYVGSDITENEGKELKERVGELDDRLIRYLYSYDDSGISQREKHE